MLTGTWLNMRAAVNRSSKLIAFELSYLTIDLLSWTATWWRWTAPPSSPPSPPPSPRPPLPKPSSPPSPRAPSPSTTSSLTSSPAWDLLAWRAWPCLPLRAGRRSWGLLHSRWCHLTWGHLSWGHLSWGHLTWGHLTWGPHREWSPLHTWGPRLPWRVQPPWEPNLPRRLPPKWPPSPHRLKRLRRPFRKRTAAS